ncbi:MAG TPA: CHAP domain-containing protein [Stellaceae bacterium]|nr:CHAP domain-containing protein [Stellaceae bacterium]
MGVTGLLCGIAIAMLASPGGASAWEGDNCVTYVRSVTGIEISGNAGDWWNNAEGRYARGHKPEPGAVLVFQPHGRMWAGHVAVVRRILNDREILVDQANWMRGEVIEGMAIYDVSPGNDWTMVRVVDAPTLSWGRLNPTFGFIYQRGDRGVMTAAYHPPTQQPSYETADDEDEAPPAHHRAAPQRTAAAKPAPEHSSRHEIATAKSAHEKARTEVQTAKAAHEKPSHEIQTAKAAHEKARHEIQTAKAAHEKSRHEIQTAKAAHEKPHRHLAAAEKPNHPTRHVASAHGHRQAELKSAPHREPAGEPREQLASASERAD